MKTNNFSMGARTDSVVMGRVTVKVGSEEFFLLGGGQRLVFILFSATFQYKHQPVTNNFAVNGIEFEDESKFSSVFNKVHVRMRKVKSSVIRLFIQERIIFKVVLQVSETGFKPW